MLLKLPQLHREFSLAHFVLREHIKALDEPESIASVDEPFGHIDMVPFGSVTVIHGELVMEVMIPVIINPSGPHHRDDILTLHPSSRAQ